MKCVVYKELRVYSALFVSFAASKNIRIFIVLYCSLGSALFALLIV